MKCVHPLRNSSSFQTTNLSKCIKLFIPCERYYIQVLLLVLRNERSRDERMVLRIKEWYSWLKSNTFVFSRKYIKCIKIPNFTSVMQFSIFVYRVLYIHTITLHIKCERTRILMMQQYHLYS